MSMETDERLLPVPKEVEQSTSMQTEPQQDYPPSYSPMYEDDTVVDKRSIREYFNVVYKRLPYILALTVLATAATAFYMYRQPSIYSARTEMIIEPKKPKGLDSNSVNINFGNDQIYYNTQLKLLKNAELMKTVIVELGLHKNDKLLNNSKRGILTTFKSMLTGGEVEKPTVDVLPIIESSEIDIESSTRRRNLTKQERQNMDRYAGYFAGRLSVEQIPNTNIVTITVIDQNPDLAAKVSNAIAKVFMKQDIDLATGGAKKRYNELADREDNLRKNIALKEKQYLASMNNSGLPLGENSSELSSGILSKLSAQLLDAVDTRRKLEADYNAAVRAKNPYGLSDSQGVDVAKEIRGRDYEADTRIQDQVNKFDNSIKEKEAELARLKVKYTPEYFKVRQAQEELATLKKSKADFIKNSESKRKTDNTRLEKQVQNDLTKGLRARLQSARKRENQILSSYERELSKANQQGQSQTRLTTLKREIDTSRGLLDEVLKEQKTTELALNSSRPENIKISSEANTPGYPIGPQRTRNIMVAFLAALVGGIGLSFLLDYLDDSIRSSDDVGRHVGLPTLALIPHHNAFEKRSLKNLTGAAPQRAGPSASALIALEDNRSAMAEAYRHLRTSLLFSSAGKPPETILVTSSQPSEGKTTTAINTAITLAQSGADVVIVDCDLRRPRLHSHFNLENTHGLTNYLSGERDTDNLLKPFANLPNLKIITSGPIPPNPAELLSSNEMKHLLQFLRGNFDHVVVDSPPAISFTDAAILSTVVDGVVLVAMAGKSSIHLMRRFKQRLGNIGARIYGVVLNGIKPNSVEYGYYGYGYTYNYYENADDDDSTPRMEDGDDTNLLEEDYEEFEYEEDDSEFDEDSETK